VYLLHVWPACLAFRTRNVPARAGTFHLVWNVS
jgi:hypothetical protein